MPERDVIRAEVKNLSSGSRGILLIHKEQIYRLQHSKMQSKTRGVGKFVIARHPVT